MEEVAQVRRRVLEVPGLGHGGQPIPLAVTLGGWLVTGGLSGRDPATGGLPSALEDEVAQLFRNILAVLSAAGAGPEAVAKITVLIRDRSYRDVVNEEWVQLFPDPADRPVRQTFVQDLPGELRVQADVLAILENRESA
jgi:enamine deaminase RidA (YjgF/YER057c/UK114 family)